MLNGLFMLLTLSTLMAISSFLAGSLPLSFPLSQSQLRFISTLGMGVLVGTSLIVIIPEGVETLYTASSAGDAHMRRSVDTEVLVNAQRNRMVAPRDAESLASFRQLLDVRESTDATSASGLAIPDSLEDAARAAENSPPKTPTEPGVVSALGNTEIPDQTQTREMPRRALHAWVGISLISGFILMYLIDVLPSLKPSPPPQRANIYSLSDLSSTTPTASSHPSTTAPFSTTLGLVIHASADGIALGATSTLPSLSFIIFFAIMIHKAPAAFSLTSVLLRQGLGKRQARVHLIAFSLAAPAGAFITWLIVSILGGSDGGSSAETTKWWTGVILLFSGGTFLYVAMHTMQDNDKSHEVSYGNGYQELSQGRDLNRQPVKKNLRLAMAAILGMLLPLVTQVGHAY